MEICIRSLKGQYWSNPIVPDKVFNELLNTKKYISFRCKFVLILEKTKYKILEWTIWIKLYFHLVKMCLKCWKNTRRNHVYFFIKVNQIFLK